MSLEFPYPGDEKHLDGKFQLYATYLCANGYQPKGPEDYCTSDRRIDIDISNGMGSGGQLHGIYLKRNSRTELLWFTAMNHCQFVVASADCTG
jgi:hypothetical protein